MKRRNFMLNLGATAGAGAFPFFANAEDKNALGKPGLDTSPSFRSDKMLKIGKPIRVSPVLVYNLLERREADTWREWGGLHTKEDVENEKARINKELKELYSRSDFPMEILPLMEVNTDEKAEKAKNTDCDVILVYAAGTAGKRMYASNRLTMLTNAGKPAIMFIRHKSGPIYLWYEIVHPRHLRDASDEYTHDNLHIDDIVVDDYGEVMWRLRALFGLQNIGKTTIIAINGTGGWGSDADEVRKIFESKWKLKAKVVSLDEADKRLDEKYGNEKYMKKIREEATQYLAQDGILSVKTEKEFIDRAFVMRDVFYDLMEEHNAQGVTVRGCMSIGKVAQTTACLPFSLVNDSGLMAFCESDFVVIPSGILLRYISGKPAFLNDPCFPHDGITTCAHCSAPRMMNGHQPEPTHILTHCESDYGAAPKVQFQKDQVITNIIPDFDSKKWVGFKGKIIDHPFYDICRSQFDCTIEGNWKKLLEDMRGFHWMTCYGDYLKEMKYVTRKVGIEFENISEETV
jgi:hypothetical protein